MDPLICFPARTCIESAAADTFYTCMKLYHSPQARVLLVRHNLEPIASKVGNVEHEQAS